MKNDKPSTPPKTIKSRLSRAMKARARIRDKHRTRTLIVARNK